MSAVFISVLIVLVYGLWQPTFFTSWSISNFFLHTPTPGKVNAVGVFSQDKPSKISSSSPEVDSLASGVYDVSSHLRLWSKNDDEVRSIASLTKLMSALVFLEHRPEWNDIQKIEVSDNREGNKANLFLGEQLTTDQLFQTALIASDNTAIIALVRSTGLSEKDFVTEMNKKASQYRLKKTVFVEPTGLDKENQSTVREVAKLAEIAFAKPEIKNALTKNSFEYTTITGREKKIVSTNDLLRLPSIHGTSLLAGKTGHLPEAGYCFVGWFENNGHEIITVVLGAPDTAARFTESAKLAAWSFKAFQWIHYKN
ncbi:MAG TPA: serine hydrolase [bacterium]|jgi:D-alanyl-D-alanine endopeptidase (penicillin-binding protein 7)|nr:serine hydrolase [bacterium]